MSEFGNFEFHNFSSMFWVESVVVIPSSVVCVLRKPKRCAGDMSLTSVGPSVSALEAVGCSHLRIKLL
jgi:hypothetical protein